MLVCCFCPRSSSDPRDCLSVCTRKGRHSYRSGRADLLPRKSPPSPSCIGGPNYGGPSLRHLPHNLVGVLGWNDTFMPGWFYRLLGCGLLACLVLGIAPGGGNRAADQTCNGRAGIASILLVYTALYIHWNAPGSATPIEGLMGRHLLPIFPALVFGFPAVKGFRDSEPLSFSRQHLSDPQFGVCCWHLIERYYLP